MKQIKASDYRWNLCDTPASRRASEAFGVLALLNGRTSVGEVEVTGTDAGWRRSNRARAAREENAATYEKNGIQFGGTFGLYVEESAALELNDGSVLFCITEGRDGGDTFTSADHITMQYYLLTPLA